MSAVAEAILHALDVETLSRDGPCLLLLPDHLRLSSAFPGAAVWQPYAHQAAIWSGCGHRAEDDLSPSPRYQTIILTCPKQKDETLYLLASALSMLKPGGRLIAAADNLGGGKTLPKLMEMLGADTSNLSKHKCRVVWSGPCASPAIEQAIAAGSLQRRADGLMTQPGLFSWDRLDIGTTLLLEHLPRSLSGLGADFGCGLGVLGLHLFNLNPGITKLYCIDADSRAIACARMNLDAFAPRCHLLWADIQKLTSLPLLDFVVMNPPFHQGRLDDTALGQSFITTASSALKPGGRLTLVANLHLPYEAVLDRHFSGHRLVTAENGFKIIEAIR